MKIFFAYRFRGENYETLGEVLLPLLGGLKAAGHDIFCSYTIEKKFREGGYTMQEIYGFCLEEMEKGYETFCALVKSNDRSRGMDMEFRKAVELDIKRVLFIRRGLEFPNFRAVANKTIEFGDYEDLYRIVEDPDLFKIGSAGVQQSV